MLEPGDGHGAIWTVPCRPDLGSVSNLPCAAGGQHVPEYDGARCTRAFSKNVISAVNLRRLGISVEMYAEKHAVYAPSLEAIAKDDLSPQTR